MEQRTDTWRKERVRKLRDPPNTIHPGQPRWSNQRQSKEGLLLLVPFHTTHSTKPFSHTRKSGCEKGEFWPYSTSVCGTDLFTFWATARASNRILARALIACSSNIHSTDRMRTIYEILFCLRIHEYMYSRLFHIYI